MSGKLYLILSLEIEVLALVWDNLLTKFIAHPHLSFLKYKTKELFIMVILKLTRIIQRTCGPTIAKTLVIETVIQ